MEWFEIFKIAGPIGAVVVGFLAYFLRKPPTILEDAQAGKIRLEAQILHSSIREESIDLLKDMLATQTELINTLRAEVQDLRKEITDLRQDYEDVWDDNNKLREELKLLKSED